MRFHLLSWVLGAGLTVVDLAAGEELYDRQTTDTTEPCALIGQSVSSGDKALDPNVALACLRSVPLAAQDDAVLLDTLNNFLGFQSNLAYLKDPPPGFLFEPVDILGAVKDIAQKLQQGYYLNEYDFQYDLYLLAASSHDFHFNYQADIVSTFKWKRAQSLVSVSKDGLSLPEIYISSDIQGAPTGSDLTVSSVAKINDVDVEDWLNAYADLQPYDHDPDANYNALLWNGPLTAAAQSNAPGIFADTLVFQGNDTVITFTNGSTTHIATYASTSKDFSGVIDGNTFFQKFCTGQVPATPDTTIGPTEETNPASITSTATATEVVLSQVSYTPVATQTANQHTSPLYPSPLVIANDLSVAGYLPNSQPDLSVLTIPTFEVEKVNITSFQNTVRELLATANSQNRTKLVIDLRGNGGGDIFLAYEVLKQLFPSITPYGASNLRLNPLFNTIATGIGSYFGNLSTSDLVTDQQQGLYSSILNPFANLDANLNAFTSAQAFLSPVTTHGDSFTPLTRANTSNPLLTPPVLVYGYGNNTAPQPQTYQPENILIIQDALCGSTCAVFAEFMKSQGKVKSIAVGGRKQWGPMQGVGGSKGSEVTSFATIGAALQFVLLNQSLTGSTSLNEQFPNMLQHSTLLFNRTQQGATLRFNTRNNIRDGDSSLTPLQFVYEAADCRFFYTQAMITDQSKVWDTAYNIHWGNGACIPGSANEQSSLSGDLLSYINAYPPIGANYTHGGNNTFPKGIINSATTIATLATPVTQAPTGASVFATGTAFLTNTASATGSTSPSPSKTGAAGRVAGSPRVMLGGLGSLFAFLLL